MFYLNKIISTVALLFCISCGSDSLFIKVIEPIALVIPNIVVTVDENSVNSLSTWGCTHSVIFTISNVGEGSLDITTIDFFASLPTDVISIIEQDVIPFTLLQDETSIIVVDVIQSDMLTDTLMISVTSNDPNEPVASVTAVVATEISAWNTDNFEVVD